jgi:hypothetical protein
MASCNRRFRRARFKFCQRQLVDTLREALRLEIIDVPDQRDHRQRNIDIVGKNAQLDAPLPLLAEEFQADLDRFADGVVTLPGVFAVEREHTLPIQSLVHPRQRAAQRIFGVFAIPQGSAGQFKQQRIIAEPFGEFPKRRWIANRYAQPRYEQGFGLRRFQFGDRQPDRVPRSLGRDSRVASRDQTRDHSIAMKKGLDAIQLPYIIDNQKAPLPLQPVDKLTSCLHLIVELRPFSGQGRIDARELVLHPGLLAQRDPENSAVAGSDNVIVVANIERERRFAVSTGALKNDGPTARVLAISIKHLVHDLPELVFSFDEVEWKVAGHVWRSYGAARAVELVHEEFPLPLQVVLVCLADPPRKLVPKAAQVRFGGALDGQDADAPLLRQPPFLLHPIGTDRGGRQDQNDIPR